MHCARAQERVANGKVGDVIMGPFLLFVMDETLVSFSQTAQAILCETVRDQLDIATQLTVSSQETDLGFVLRACNDVGIRHADQKSTARAVLRAYADRFAKSRKALTKHAAIFAGAREAVHDLDDAGVFLSVLTPRIAAVAIEELSASRMMRELDLEIGGFGNDANTRDELVGIARSRADKLRDWIFDDRDVWIVGSSTDSMMLAKQCGVRSLGLAIGRCSEADLRSAGADQVFADYGYYAAFEAAILT